jgi:hypothetical protein
MMAWKRVLNEGKWLPNVVHLQNNVSPARNKTIDGYTSLKSKGIKQETLLSQNCSNISDLYQQRTLANGCKICCQKSSKDTRN